MLVVVTHPTLGNLLGQDVQTQLTDGGHRRQVWPPVDSGASQQIQGDAGGLADRSLSSRQRERRQMPDPGEFDRVCDYQKFPAPDGPVRTVAGAVECHRDDRCAQAPAIGEQRNGVGMVVLHRDDGLAAGLPVRPRGGGIPGVQVTGEDVGSAAGHEGKVVRRGLEAGLGARVGHVTEMGRQMSLCRPVRRGPHQAERGLEIPAGGQDDLGRLAVHGHRQRCIAARSPDRHFPALIVDGDDGVLARYVDRPVVGEDDVGQALDPVQVLIPEDDRRAALIGRSHHQRYRAQPIEEQMMQRRIGQHQTKVGQAGSHRLRDGSRAGGHKDDWRGRRRQRRRCRIVDQGEFSRRLEVCCHHRKGLGGPVLSHSQLCDDTVVVGPASQMETANPLDRENFPGQNRIRGGIEGRRQHRPAVRASDGLRMESSVQRIAILRCTGGAHRKARHCGGRPVIRQIGDHRVAGARSWCR